MAKVKLGNFQKNGTPEQDNDLLTLDYFTDFWSLSKYKRNGVYTIAEQFRFPGFSFSRKAMEDIFALFRNNKDKIDGFTVFGQEEIFLPSRTPQVSPTTTYGSSYMLEGVNIPAMPGNETAYFVALLTAWKKMCVELGKDFVVCGSPAVCSDDAVWDYMYSKEGAKYIAEHADKIVIYHYPTTLAEAQGTDCKQANKNIGKRDAKSYITQWRNRGFKGDFIYILVTEFPDNAGTSDINVIKADFKRAADNLTEKDTIVTYPYAHKSGGGAVKRMIGIYKEYIGANPMPEPINKTTVAYIADARCSKYGQSGIDELKKDLNQIVPKSPTGKVDAIVMVGDMDRIAQTMQAYNASNVKSIPLFLVTGNHEAENSADMTALRNAYANYKFIKHPGMAGSSTTTYSIDLPDIHLCIINEYWNGLKNDAYFKYGGGDGGYIHQLLYDWIKTDLTASRLQWKIVIGHEPLYPWGNHSGNSLDKDKANRDKFQALLVSMGIPIFVAGHTHFAGVEKHDTVYHSNCGNTGGQAGGSGQDDFASIIYTHVDDKGNLILTWTRENPTWTNPKVTAYLIPGTVVPPIPPIPPTPVGDNLIPNPGFENGVIDSWEFVTKNNNTPTWDSSVVHSGTKSAKISIPGTVNTESGLIQSFTVPVNPSAKYIASVWGRTENCGGGNTPAARIVELDINKVFIRQTNILPVFARGTNDWSKKTLEFTTTATTAFVYIYANIWQGYGNFWMDDVELRQVL